jgi:hypothetical protein
VNNDRTAQGLISHSRRRSSINSDNQSDGSSRDSAKSTRRNSESSCQPDRVTETGSIVMISAPYCDSFGPSADSFDPKTDASGDVNISIRMLS